MINFMPLVDEFSTRKEWRSACWQQLVLELQECPASKLRQLLETIVSPRERMAITTRAIVAVRLGMGATYRAIGREVWLSPRTISAIKKGIAGANYDSGWAREKMQRRIRQAERWRAQEKDLPPRYRRTKYGRMRVW